MTVTMISPNIEPLPESMRHLRVDPDRGFPVPWFVAWIDGKPEFRMADAAKWATAVNQNRCWVCGKRHEPGRMTFVIGPMCGINRVSSEPPSHPECARYSARNCPFLARPQMARRGPEEVAAMAEAPAGFMIERNPGVTLLWTTDAYRLFSDGKGGRLFAVGEPLQLEFFARGGAASREEVLRSVETGLPTLTGAASRDGPAAVRQLERMTEALLRLIPGPAAAPYLPPRPGDEGDVTASG